MSENGNGRVIAQNAIATLILQYRKNLPFVTVTNPDRDMIAKFSSFI